MYSQFQAYSNEMFTNDEISGQKRAEKKKELTTIKCLQMMRSGAEESRIKEELEIRGRREPNKGARSRYREAQADTSGCNLRSAGDFSVARLTNRCCISKGARPA